MRTRTVLIQVEYVGEENPQGTVSVQYIEDGVHAGEGGGGYPGNVADACASASEFLQKGKK